MADSGRTGLRGACSCRPSHCYSDPYCLLTAAPEHLLLLQVREIHQAAAAESRLASPRQRLQRAKGAMSAVAAFSAATGGKFGWGSMAAGGAGADAGGAEGQGGGGGAEPEPEPDAAAPDAAAA
eukprot:SAG22_NODE_3578_length_1633_cov_1.331812_2_plen_123_part_01